MPEIRNDKGPAPVVQSFNEWDPLEEVIVGTVLGATYPECGPVLAAAGEPEWLWHYQGVLVEEESVQAAHEQLEELVSVLKGEGVTVRRPDPFPHNVGYSTPFWQCRSGWNTANPRDLFLVVGNEIIECASPMRHRYFEAHAYQRLFTEYFRAGARLTAAPKPALRDALYDHNCRPAPPGVDLGKRIHFEGQSRRYPITELEPVWEAADFVRCGRDLFGIRSVVTNALGIEWVRRHLGEGFRVHEIKTRCSTPLHIDTTFVPLAPGKVLVNPDWINVAELPECLRKWDVLQAPRPTYDPDSPMASPQFSSQWLSMNVLSLDHERVIVDAQQHKLVRKLEEWGFTPIPVHFDHFGPFGGSFHCATLDVRRRGQLASYF